MKNTFYIFILMIFSSLSLFCSDNSTGIIDKYFNKQSILEEREKTHLEFKTSDKSPLTDEDKKDFKCLNYFPISIDYVFLANLKQFEKQDTVKMLTSKKNKTKLFIRYGQMQFKHLDTSYALTAYVILPINEKAPIDLFLPFIDLTCEDESYGAGRYIDIPLHKESVQYIIDFNLAYNPYCAYNKKYSCPLVPQENVLPFSVKAGEMNYKKRD